MDITKLKEGQFYYARHRGMWGVWKVGKVLPSGSRFDDFVSDFSTDVQAKAFVYKMNGWQLKS